MYMVQILILFDIVHFIAERQLCPCWIKQANYYIIVFKIIYISFSSAFCHFFFASSICDRLSLIELMNYSYPTMK